MNEDKKASQQPQGGGGNKGDSQKVSFLKLFIFADRLDVLHMVVGTIGAIANGLSQPLMTLIFGNLIHSFGSTNRDHVVKEVSKAYVAVLFLYLALSAGVASFLEVASCAGENIGWSRTSTSAWSETTHEAPRDSHGACGVGSSRRIFCTKN